MSTESRVEELAVLLESRNGNARGFGLGPVCDEAAAELRRLAAECEALRAVMKEPKPGLLMSMAIRYDHGLGMPGFYDSDFYKSQGPHARRLESTLRVMRQLWEEVAGQGFYKPDREADYAAMADAAMKASHD